MSVDGAIAEWKRIREMYDWPKHLPTLADTLVAEVERLRAELATIKSEGIPPVIPNSMWTDDSGRLVVYCKTTHNAMQLQEWLHERIKIT